MGWTKGALVALLLAAHPALAEEFGVFHVAPGVEETYHTCTSCHSERIIAQQGLTRDGWDDLLVWMTEDMGMGELPPQLREPILDYLATNYGPDRPNFPR